MSGQDVESLNRISGQIVDAAIKVHRALGPGLLESAYEACLLYELRRRGLQVQSQIPQPVVYEDVHLDVGYRLDLIVENEVVVELKAVEPVLPIHKAQLMSHLKLSNKRLGLLINFHCELFKHGIMRIANNL
ncbi:MAG TPA: GxxExxY protein [Pirellulales bacterium]|jgi:GxxExxY protein|nr:GxxExxY protein [Pirellulales bacterium]